MKLGGVAAVGGSLLGYAGAAAIQEQVIHVPLMPPGDPVPPVCSNPQESTLTPTTRPSPKSLSLHLARTPQPPLQPHEGRWRVGRQGAGEEAFCHLVGSSGSGEGVLSRFARRGGMGAGGGWEVGAAARRRKMGAGRRKMGAGRKK